MDLKQIKFLNSKRKEYRGVKMEDRKNFSVLLIKNKENVTYEEFCEYFNRRMRVSIKDKNNCDFNELLEVLYKKSSDEYKIFYQIFSKTTFKFVRNNSNIITNICKLDISNSIMVLVFNRIYMREKSIANRTVLSEDYYSDYASERIAKIKKVYQQIIDGDQTLINKCRNELHQKVNSEIDILYRSVINEINKLYQQIISSNRTLTDKCKDVLFKQVNDGDKVLNEQFKDEIETEEDSDKIAYKDELYKKIADSRDPLIIEYKNILYQRLINSNRNLSDRPDLYKEIHMLNAFKDKLLQVYSNLSDEMLIEYFDEASANIKSDLLDFINIKMRNDSERVFGEEYAEYNSYKRAGNTRLKEKIIIPSYLKY